jgi:16S rRNA (adenine1518-N6/adenine1519-N6)-dimethyltransferase
MTDSFLNLDILPSLKETVDAYDLRAKKSLGQNFLFDQNITDRIAAQSGADASTIITEIGPGPGGLTRSLLNRACVRVIALEFDPRAIAALQPLKNLAGDRLDVRHTDALKTDWNAHFTQGAPHYIVANLPYNIATVLLVDWLRFMRAHPCRLTGMVLMFQREVADRLWATPSTPEYGRLSVLCQWLCTVDPVMTLPPGAFSPPPKVHSSVVRFTPKPPRENAPSFDRMEKLLQRAFGHRRKMLRSNLKDDLHHLAALGIEPTKRAEDLSVDQFVALSTRMDKISL